jgi:hypothetical protein
MLYMEHHVSSDHPYQVYFRGTINDDFRNRIAAVDAWCAETWGIHDDDSEYSILNRGWAFTQESDALLLMITWC